MGRKGSSFMKVIFLLLALISFNANAGQNVRLEFDLNVQAGFAQKTRFLFSVDNSGSMSPHQQTFKGTVEAALKPMLDNQLPFEVIIFNTDSFQTFHFDQVDQNTPDVIKNVQDLIAAAGTSGGADERSMESFLQIMNKLNVEQSFLNFVILSDEPDYSATSVETFYQSVVALNDGRSDLVNLYVVAQDETVNCKGGANDNNVKYDEMIAKFGNNSKRVQMCDSAVITQLMGEIGDSSVKATKGQDPKPVYLPYKSVKLAMTPVFETLKVSYGSQVFDKGSLPGGYVFYQTENKILFGDSVQLKYQPQGTKLVIEYETEDDIIATESALLDTVLELH